MNFEVLRNKLLAAARAERPSDQVPYAFEKRVMNLLSKSRLHDLSSFWANALWRAAAPCAAIMVLLAAWAFFSPDAPSHQQTTDLAQEFDNTLLAAGDPDTPPAAD